MTYSIVNLGASQPSLHDTWDYIRAQNLLRGALADLEEACRVLSVLTAETNWQVRSKPVTTLHRVIALHERGASEALRHVRAEADAYLV